MIITCGLTSARSVTVKVCTHMGALSASSDPSTAATSFTVVAGERLIIEIDAQAVVVEIRGDGEETSTRGPDHELSAVRVASEVIRKRRGGRRAGLDTTVLTDSVDQWCRSLSKKAAAVALYVAQHDGTASCTEARQHLGNLFHDGRPVSPAALGGVMACGGRALRVDRDGGSWRPIDLDGSGDSYVMDQETVAAVLAALSPSGQAHACRDEHETPGALRSAVPAPGVEPNGARNP